MNEPVINKAPQEYYLKKLTHVCSSYPGFDIDASQHHKMESSKKAEG
ncbi:hypothetical protein [Oceanospirillum sediminis]|uniref:Uncharacterized protein n=1 Tax=Oceanospirillum sediminis TaxID=2760088 RepID=A0A839IXU8_9GAMM|nr:hypothetical protein [Oceanospirillum sediminis]MBB1489269.1 hypothetical protein [Oceanospirillum sediminis]